MPCDDCGQISLFGPDNERKPVAYYRIFLGYGQKRYSYELENPSRYILEQWKKYERRSRRG